VANDYSLWYNLKNKEIMNMNENKSARTIHRMFGNKTFRTVLIAIISIILAAAITAGVAMGA
jgi:hypothetical protein